MTDIRLYALQNMIGLCLYVLQNMINVHLAQYFKSESKDLFISGFQMMLLKLIVISINKWIFN